MSTTNPKEYVELLKVFSITLANGILDKNEILKWADEIIIKDTEPDYFIIELSLCGHKSANDIISLISEYIGVGESQIAGRITLGILYNQYISCEIPLKKVIDTISWLVWKSDLSEEEKKYLYGVDDEYYCAQEGIYGTVEEVEKYILKFLATYKEFSLDNFESWFKINELINSFITEPLKEEIVKKEFDSKEIQSENTKRKWWKLW